MQKMRFWLMRLIAGKKNGYLINIKLDEQSLFMLKCISEQNGQEILCSNVTIVEFANDSN